ncbi:MAG: hypothetical protein H6828_12945 [Planctomycetes bacterium]|nr:hypothetical protein [Planctomycetota bacterium]
MARRVLVVGSGERVRKAALPVFAACEGLEVAGVVSRKPKEIEAGGERYAVSALDALDAARLAEVDLVYMVVSKPAVPSVLAHLRRFDVARLELLIETPVMLVRHFGHLDRLAGFRAVSVTEDTEPLPCFAPIHALERSGELGALVSATFDRSAYAYHGVAMAKAALSGARVVRARQRRLDAGRRERVLTVARSDGALRSATLLDPRDYAAGTLRFEFERGVVCDHDDPAATLRLEPLLEGEALAGFRAGDHVRRFDDVERALVGPRGAGPGATAWMDGLKRVGLLALMRSVVAGGGAYPLDAALEDALVDYALERGGRYVATRLADPRRGLGRLGFKLLTALAGR